MDLWLSPHDAKVVSLRSGGDLLYGFGNSHAGECVVLTTGTHLLALRFITTRREALATLEEKWPHSTLHHSKEADGVIKSVFARPESVPLLAIGTPFQLSVWNYLRDNTDAVTLTYGEVAAAVGHPRAARAVGQAMGRNEIAVLIACHRVVSRGKLTGYRWGLGRKRALLSWELSRRNPLEMPF